MKQVTPESIQATLVSMTLNSKDKKDKLRPLRGTYYRGVSTLAKPLLNQ